MMLHISAQLIATSHTPPWRQWRRSSFECILPSHAWSCAPFHSAAKFENDGAFVPSLITDGRYPRFDPDTESAASCDGRSSTTTDTPRASSPAWALRRTAPQ